MVDKGLSVYLQDVQEAEESESKNSHQFSSNSKYYQQQYYYRLEASKGTQIRKPTIKTPADMVLQSDRHIKV